MRTCTKGLPEKLTHWEEIEVHLCAAIQVLLERDSDMLNIEASERSLGARLACYLDRELNPSQLTWNVDCDYNRVLSEKNSKRQPRELLQESIKEFIEISKEKLAPFGKYLAEQDREIPFQEAIDALSPKANQSEADCKRRLTTPDIIIHERACSDLNHNLLAIEIKPYWNKDSRVLDLARMKAFTVTKHGEDGELFPTYQYGLTLYFEEEGTVGGWLFAHNKNEVVKFPVFASS